MVDYCEKCKNYYIGSKPIIDIGGSRESIPQHKCKLHHRIDKNAYGVYVPFTNGYVCEDFNPK